MDRYISIKHVTIYPLLSTALYVIDDLGRSRETLS